MVATYTPSTYTLALPLVGPCRPTIAIDRASRLNSTHAPAWVEVRRLPWLAELDVPADQRPE